MTIVRAAQAATVNSGSVAAIQIVEWYPGAAATWVDRREQKENIGLRSGCGHVL
jgi:hypothetical protein